MADIENMVTPEFKVTLGGKEYTLSGKVKALKDIQQALGVDIYDLHPMAEGKNVFSLRFDQAAVVLHIGIKASGETPPSLDEIEQLVLDDGVDEIKLHLAEYILMSISPKKDREKNLEKLRAILDQFRKVPETEETDSLGDSSKSSA